MVEHSLDKLVASHHQNVCRDGFGVEAIADAVFLDLPAPWDAIEHAKRTLKRTRKTRICCFSPCIEQVQRTIQALEACDFVEIEVVNCLLREWETRAVTVYDFPEIVSNSERNRKRPANDAGAQSATHVAQPKSEMRGHTSFLTFALFHAPFQ